MTPAAIVASVDVGDAAAEAALPSAPSAPSPPPSVTIPVLHSFAVMAVVRGAESYLYPDPFSKPQYFKDHWVEAFSKPPIFDASKPAFRWDGDPLPINVVGHALLGSELYLRARQCRWGAVGAFFFAAATSAVWEYGFEGNGVRPSAQDLVYTPVAGILLGEARYFTYHAVEALRPRAARLVVRFLVDPLGEIERASGAGC